MPLNVMLDFDSSMPELMQQISGIILGEGLAGEVPLACLIVIVEMLALWYISRPDIIESFLVLSCTAFGTIWCINLRHAQM